MKIKLTPDELDRYLKWLEHIIHRHRAAKFTFVFVDLQTGKVTRQQGEEKMSYTLPVDKKVAALIQPVDAYGNIAKVEGAPVWAVSDPTLANLTPAADGLSAVVEPIGTVGIFQLSVKADADLGAGVREVIGLADIELVAGDAVAVNVSFGPPEPR